MIGRFAGSRPRASRTSPTGRGRLGFRADRLNQAVEQILNTSPDHPADNKPVRAMPWCQPVDPLQPENARRARHGASRHLGLHAPHVPPNPNGDALDAHTAARDREPVRREIGDPGLDIDSEPELSEGDAYLGSCRADMFIATGAEQL